jgi:Protein of unknown function (DUF1501)
MASFEFAFRTQQEALEAFDLSRESAAMPQLYGTDPPTTELVGRQCMIAWRLAERGVRCIQLSDAPNRTMCTFMICTRRSCICLVPLATKWRARFYRARR